MNKSKVTKILKQTIENPIKMDLYYSETAYLKRHIDRYCATLEFLANNSINVNKMRVVDIGVFPGHFSILLRKIYKAKVLGIGKNFSTSFLDRMNTHGVRCLDVNVELEKFPIKEESCDIVFSCEILEHLYKNPSNMLRETFRIMKPGGYLFLSTPNLLRLSTRLRAVLGKNILWPLDGPLGYFDLSAYDRHNREFSLNEIEYLLKNNNFKELINVFGYNRPLNIVKNPYAKLINLTSRLKLTFSEDFFFLCKK
jgi:2-polyprenyl-6-hydroxyphenyl methylase/3-demethylubiquinone-9 3-methyltransferase